jgi:hypothetical protein
MAGTIFSGWHGRRSGKPYFDELPRLAAGDCKHLDPGLLAVTADGKDYAVRLVRIPSGCMTRPAFICASCGKHCRVVYLRGIACCYRCTGAIYRSGDCTVAMVSGETYDISKEQALGLLSAQSPGRYFNMHIKGK